MNKEQISMAMTTRQQAKEYASMWLTAWTGNDPPK
jgi:hypothetical protein